MRSISAWFWEVRLYGWCRAGYYWSESALTPHQHCLKLQSSRPNVQVLGYIFKTGLFLAFIIIISLVLQNSSELSLLIRLNHAFEGENTKEHQQEVSDQWSLKISPPCYTRRCVRWACKGVISDHATHFTCYISNL